MSITQFGSHYFDPADVVAINTKPLVNRSRGQDSDVYFVYIRNVSKPILLVGDEARECLTTFLGETKTSKKQKESAKKEDEK